MKVEQCSTKRGQRNHYRETGSAATLCGRKAIERLTDQKHRGDPYCHRCATIQDRWPAEGGTQ